MRKQETELLEHIISLNVMEKNCQSGVENLSLIWDKESIINQSFDMLQCEKLGTVSRDFIKNPMVVSFIDKQYDTSLKFWYFIQNNELEEIEKKIKELITEYQLERKKGIGMPPSELYSRTLIRSVYLSENPALIDIFKRYLPIPGTDVFEGNEIPEVVVNNKIMIEKSIQTLQNRTSSNSLDEITDNVIKIQRQVRSKLRHQEEIRRISSRDVWQYEIKKTPPEKLIQDANTPYRPRCTDKGLAKRIMVAAQQVRLFSTVKHWTSGEHIESIFNDSLYGRRHLLKSYLPFKPASLFPCDIKDGDGNVICFGPYEIDPQAMKKNTVEILFDLDKLSENNPSIFFKQRDLGFGLDKKRFISVNKSNPKSLTFSQTNSVRCAKEGFSYLSVFDGKWGGIKAAAWLPNYSLISYNVKNIHQILTLNFFRFLDSNKNENFEPIRNELYTELSKLPDEELLQFLLDIGRQLSDTSEFNFYGAHRIDFSTVIALSSYQDGKTVFYTLNLQNLIVSLEKNDIRMINEAKVHLPGVFNSYRFLDYLLSKVTSIAGSYELQRLRSKCVTPTWIKPISEPEPLPMPIESYFVPSLIEEDTLSLVSVIATHSDHDTTVVEKKEAIIPDIELHQVDNREANEMTRGILPKEILQSDIEQQDHAKIEDQSRIIPTEVKIEPAEEKHSGSDIRAMTSETNSLLVSSGEDATLIDAQSCMPSSFIIGMYATGSVLLITGILICALLIPVVAAFVGITLSPTAIGVLATAGPVGIITGAATIFSTWCGFFNQVDTYEGNQPFIEPSYSAQTVIL